MQNDILPPPRAMRPMMIKGLTPSLPERGKIKIGRKGAVMKSAKGNEFQPPVKQDHFTVTTLDRAADGNFARDEAAHKRLGDKPTRIPVRLLYDDPTLNFPTRYACYAGRTLWCSGDGDTAQRVRGDGKGHDTVQCTCERQDPAYKGQDKCKMNGALSVLLEGGGGIGGVWKMRTTSYNSIVGILSTMAFLRSITGGPLANIPLVLTLTPKQVTDPVQGKQQTIYVVGLEYDGDVPQLQSTGHQIALERAKTHLSITHIEEEARQLLLAAPRSAPLPGDDNDDVIEEFYPEQVERGPAPPRPTRESVAAAQEDEIDASPPFSVTDSDGVAWEFFSPDEATDRIRAVLTEAAGLGIDALNKVWSLNDAFGQQMEDAGHELTWVELSREYKQMCADLSGPREVNNPSYTPENNAGWRDYVAKALRAIANHTTVSAVETWLSRNDEHLTACAEWSTGEAARVRAAADARIADLFGVQSSGA